jgi:hypothetical protein
MCCSSGSPTRCWVRPGRDRSREWYGAVGGPALAKRTSLEGQWLLVKSATVARASIGPVHDIERVRRTGTAWVAIGRAAGLISRAARRRWGTTAANDRHPRDRVQLTIW